MRGIEHCSYKTIRNSLDYDQHHTSPSFIGSQRYGLKKQNLKCYDLKKQNSEINACRRAARAHISISFSVLHQDSKQAAHSMLKCQICTHPKKTIEHMHLLQKHMHLPEKIACFTFTCLKLKNMHQLQGKVLWAKWLLGAYFACICKVRI